MIGIELQKSGTKKRKNQIEAVKASMHIPTSTNIDNLTTKLADIQIDETGNLGIN